MSRWFGADRPVALVAAVACGALTVLLAGCSGGGGGGSDPVTCTSLSFDRALATPSSGDVYIEQAAGTCNSIDLTVIVNGLSGIWSVSFDLDYPAAEVQYQSYTLGPLLQKGTPPIPPFVLVQEIPTGLQVTMTLFAGDPPVSATGSESLIVLHFSRLAPGSGPIDFDTGAGSTVGEAILDQNGLARPAVFSPGHGGVVLVP